MIVDYSALSLYFDAWNPVFQTLRIVSMRRVIRFFFSMEFYHMTKKTIPSIISILFISCAAGYFYDFSLLDVERPNDATEKFGMATIKKTPDSTAVEYEFSDNLAGIKFFITENQFEFVMKNKTDNPIKILWEKAAYINSRGVHKRIIHSGINYTDKAWPQKPTVVSPAATLSDYMLPSDNVSVYLYGNGGWTIYPIFSKNDYGRIVKVLFPMEVAGVEKDYVFRFKINAVK
jgi:hypothetical protein